MIFHIAITPLIFSLLIFAFGLQTVGSFAENVTKGPPPPDPLTVNTNKRVYHANETIMIYGVANSFASDNPTMVFEVISPMKQTFSQVVKLSSNGSYVYNFDSTILSVTGEYTILASYGNFSAVTPFMFIANPYYLTIDENHYFLNYETDSGLLTNVTAHTSERSVTLHITNATSPAKLVIELPRALIDSRNGNSDMPFSVMLDSGQAQFIEINKTNTIRTLVINIPYEGYSNPLGIWDMKVIGTQIVPEFNVAMPLIASGVVGVLLFSLVTRRQR